MGNPNAKVLQVTHRRDIPTRPLGWTTAQIRQPEPCDLGRITCPRLPQTCGPTSQMRPVAIEARVHVASILTGPKREFALKE